MTTKTKREIMGTGLESAMSMKGDVGNLSTKQTEWYAKFMPLECLKMNS